MEKCNFPEAIAMASRLVDKVDPRMAELTARAEALVAQATNQRAQWEQRIKIITAQATEAAARKDHHRVVELLGNVPQLLMDASLKSLLRTSQAFLGEWSEQKNQLRTALQEKNYVLAGNILDQLLALAPEEEEYRQLATKVGEALLGSAIRRFDTGQYAAALERLGAVPTFARQQRPEYQQLSEKIGNVTWLIDQIARSPFATPTLGHFVQRLASLAPGDPRPTKLLPQLAARLKSPDRQPYQMFPAWAGKLQGWKGAEVCLPPAPRKMIHAQTPLVGQHPTRFAVAIGLGLQGLRRGEVNHSLSTGSGGGMLRKLLQRRGASKVAWGIDIGSSAIRAVKLEAVKLEDGSEKITVVQAEVVPFDEPLCRTSVEMKAQVLIREKLVELANRLGELKNIPLWTNLPARDTLARFLSMPPAAHAQVEKLLEQELQTQFPLPLEQLCHYATIIGTPVDGSPRALFLAAKRTTVEQREKLFSEAGIELAGIQADPIALHHFARLEYAELYGDKNAPSATPPCVSIIDSGATGSILYLGTHDAFWFRFVDGAGEDLTVKLAAVLGITHQQAEQLKRAPWTIPSLALGMDTLQQRIEQTAVRMRTSFDQGDQFLANPQVGRILLTGGNALAHSWLRHLFGIQQRAAVTDD